MLKYRCKINDTCASCSKLDSAQEYCLDTKEDCLLRDKNPTIDFKLSLTIDSEFFNGLQEGTVENVREMIKSHCSLYSDYVTRIDIDNALVEVVKDKQGENPYKFITHLAETFSEKRSDIVDMCNQFLLTGKIINEEITPESRYIKAKIPNTEIEVEYDTYTTELAYHKPLEQWEQCTDHKYTDDEYRNYTTGE